LVAFDVRLVVGDTHAQRVSSTSTSSVADRKQQGAWRSGNRYVIPTSPHTPLWVPQDFVIQCGSRPVSYNARGCVAIQRLS
jgi:hypothetical protein